MLTPVRVSHTSGSRSFYVPGQVYGIWAATKSFEDENLWHVTHVPTGHKATTNALSEKDANNLAAELAQKFPEFACEAPFCIDGIEEMIFYTTKEELEQLRAFLSKKGALP